MPRFPRAASGAAVVCALGAGCWGAGAGGDSSAARSDSAERAAGRVEQPAPRVDTLTQLAPATPTPTTSSAPLAPPEAPPRTDSARSDADPTPTAAELAALRAALIMPLGGVDPASLVSTFDEARGGGTRRHEALDIVAPRGTPVRSAAAGHVLKLHDSEAGGLMVYASDPSERFVLMYGHLDGYAPGLRDGAPLRAGETIGYVGTTGNAGANNPHLHFAIARVGSVTKWWTGTAVDPLPLLRPASTAP